MLKIQEPTIFYHRGEDCKTLHDNGGGNKGRSWQKRDFILNCQGGTNKLCFTVWNNDAPTSHLDEGDLVRVEFLIKTKEKENTITTYLVAKRIFLF